MEDPVPIVHEDWKRERLTKKTSREPVEMSSSNSGPKRMRLSCLRVNNVNAVQKPSTRTEDSIAKSRLLETGGVKDWNREDAIKTGAKILSGRMVDDAHKKNPDTVRESLPRSRTHQCSRLRRMLTTLL